MIWLVGKRVIKSHILRYVVNEQLLNTFFQLYDIKTSNSCQNRKISISLIETRYYLFDFTKNKVDLMSFIYRMHFQVNTNCIYAINTNSLQLFSIEKKNKCIPIIAGIVAIIV